MAITITKEPAALSLCKNKVEVEFTTDNLYSSNGVKASLLLNFVNADWNNVDQAFTLSWGTNEVTFTAKLAPDNSGLQFQTRESTALTTYITNGFVSWLNKNYLINRDFIVTKTSGTQAKLEAREVGSEYSLTFSDSTFTNMSEGTNTSGTDKTARDNFGIVVKCLDANDNVIGEDVLSCDEDGVAKVNIAELLAPELTNDFEYPEVNAQNIVLRDEMHTTYYLKYAETYDGVVKGLSQSRYYRTFKGGIGKFMENYLETDSETFIDVITDNKQFLTWCPKTKYTDVNSIEKLGFLFYDTFSHAIIRLKAKVYFTDGTNTTVTKGTIEDYDLYDIIEIECGYEKLALADVDPAKTVSKYDIWLQNDLGTVFSEVRTYIIDTKYYSNPRYFIFKNSLGVYETIRFTGIKEMTDEISRTEFSTRYVAAGLKHREISSRTDNALMTYKHSTGWLTKETVDWSNELILSEDVFFIYGNRLYPVVNMSSKVPRKKDDEYLYAREIEYKIAWNSPLYSNDGVTQETEHGGFDSGFDSGFENQGS